MIVHIVHIYVYSLYGQYWPSELCYGGIISQFRGLNVNLSHLHWLVPDRNVNPHLLTKERGIWFTILLFFKIRYCCQTFYMFSYFQIINTSMKISMLLSFHAICIKSITVASEMLPNFLCSEFSIVLFKCWFNNINMPKSTFSRAVWRERHRWTICMVHNEKMILIRDVFLHVIDYFLSSSCFKTSNNVGSICFIFLISDKKRPIRDVL